MSGVLPLLGGNPADSISVTAKATGLYLLYHLATVEALGLRVVGRRIRREELYTCDEAFFTGTAAEVTQIIEVDGRLISNEGVGNIVN